MGVVDVWALYERLQAQDLASLTADERLVLAFGEVRTEVNSGGFESYLRYSYRLNASAAAQAARLADCPELAEIIEAAVAFVGGDVVRLDDEDAITDRLDGIQRDLDDLDQRFYRLEATTDLDAAQARLVARLGCG